MLLVNMNVIIYLYRTRPAPV